MQHRSAESLLLLLLLTVFMLHLLRGNDLRVVPPMSFVVQGTGWIYVPDEDGRPGARQISDDFDLGSVDVLTDDSLPGRTLPKSPELKGKVSFDGEGAQIDFDPKRGESPRMRAAHRIALAIPLHPDRMNEADWRILPGVGDKRARRIVRDRQENGDFRTLEGVRRVKGVGPKRIQQWRRFFILL